jgi:hypothetical protein
MKKVSAKKNVIAVYAIDSALFGCIFGLLEANHSFFSPKPLRNAKMFVFLQSKSQYITYFGWLLKEAI